MLIDANVFKGYYHVEVGMAHELQGCPKALVESATKDSPIYHDVGGKIEFEWGSALPREWFSAWLANKLQSGVIQYLQPVIDTALEKRLLGLGFPPGRDKVYCRMGTALADLKKPCALYSEDIDFYDPKEKGCPKKRRIKILTKSAGPVAKLLRKRGVSVLCVP